MSLGSYRHCHPESTPNALPHPDSSLKSSRASWLRFRPNRLKPSEPPATRSSGTTSRFGKTDPPRRPGRIQYRCILAALIFPFLQPKLGLDAPITLFQPPFSFTSDCSASTSLVDPFFIPSNAKNGNPYPTAKKANSYLHSAGIQVGLHLVGPLLVRGQILTDPSPMHGVS